MKLTADTITDEQIRELMRTGLSESDLVACQEALSWGRRFGRKQRARCAEILNARAEGKS